MADVLEGKRLLAVDDEPDILETLDGQLSEFEGLQLDKATDYESGYHILRSWTYDLVILDINGSKGIQPPQCIGLLGFPTVMVTAHALSVKALKRSVQMRARAYIPKEKISEVVPFLEDVLVLENRPGWKRLFDRLGGFFNLAFGPDWQKDEKGFWDEVASGQCRSEPMILKK